MLCQDLRKREVSSTFFGNSESVRDVQFCPHHYFLFAAAYENGNIQVSVFYNCVVFVKHRVVPFATAMPSSVSCK